MDARRGQVYNALFEWRGGRPVRLCADRAIALDELAAELAGFAAENQLTADKEPTAATKPATLPSISTAPCILVGDGFELALDRLRSAGVSCEVAPELMRRQTAYGVALAAADAGAERVSAAVLEPSYLRPSQAERERSHST
jgi:tRNA threonylcarbamoyladenosine biosynthesis protein TsaB